MADVTRTNLLEAIVPWDASSERTAGGGVVIGTVIPGTQVNLRLPSHEPGSVTRAESVLGCPLPLRPNTTAEWGGRTVMWLGPDEWLVVEQRTAPELEQSLRAACTDSWCSVVDVSANRIGLTLHGPRTLDVLMTCCTLDMRERTFAVGDCAQSTVGRAPVILHRTDRFAFTLWVRPSYARYLARLLLDAVREFA